ncbi:MAG TPA: MFS transporter [Magnetospirillaceae bacterium]|jgi:predicted MFS family arabinose efflux permease
MSTDQTTTSTEATQHGPSVALLTTMAVAAGALVANLYYAQPLIASIAPDIAISKDLAGSIVSITQIGYGIGLLFLVSLADLVENKRLVLVTLAVTALGLVGAAISTSVVSFFAASFVIGVASTGAQVVIPFVVHLAPPERRGRIVGNVMVGLLTGIMLARPAALFIGSALGWRAVFWASAGLMIVIGLSLWRMMPEHKPRSGMHYGQILLSMVKLFREFPSLRRRASYQAVMFCGFNMFWTTVPLMLSDRLHLSQQAIALFALAGAGGAFAAPIAGRLADRGLIRATTVGMMILAGVTFFSTRFAVDAMMVVPLAILAILFDGAVQGNQICSQRIIFSGPMETRGRVNAIYMTSLFFSGAIGSVVGTVSYHHGGWELTSAIGGLLGVAMLMLFATELRQRPHAA